MERGEKGYLEWLRSQQERNAELKAYYDRLNKSRGYLSKAERADLEIRQSNLSNEPLPCEPWGHRVSSTTNSVGDKEDPSPLDSVKRGPETSPKISKADEPQAENGVLPKLIVCTDSAKVGLKALAAGFHLLLCQHILTLGGGVSPSMGLVASILKAARAFPDARIYLLIRPNPEPLTASLADEESTEGAQRENEYAMIENEEVRAWTSFSYGGREVDGFFVPCTHLNEEGGNFRSELRPVSELRSLRQSAGSRLLVAHRSLATLDSCALPQAVAELKNAGWNAVVAAAQGDGTSTRVRDASRVADAARDVGLPYFLQLMGADQLPMRDVRNLLPASPAGEGTTRSSASTTAEAERMLPLVLTVSAQRPLAPVLPWRLWHCQKHLMTEAEGWDADASAAMSRVVTFQSAFEKSSISL